jgi:molybdopterin/thiamine biosynthesis adenylyltransferase
MSFSPEELERYARHVVLHEIGGIGQRRLREARVLVVGAGGLGSPGLLYLAAAGVGTLGIVDDDVVSLSNLQRQVLHGTEDVGVAKVDSAMRQLARNNPHVRVLPYCLRLTDGNISEILADFDLVLDGSDNFQTRYMVNAACVAAGKPLISGAMSQWEGQLGLFHPAGGGPCYHCVFPEEPDPELVPSCALAGIVGALPGIMGSMMALEAVKLITGAGTGVRGRLFVLDSLHLETRTFSIRARAGCPVCGGAGE